MTVKQGRSWCFTVNNYTAADEDLLRGLHENGAIYLVFGREVGESGTAHLQGYVRFEKTKRFAGVKKLLPTGCHIECAQANAQTNKEYCSKDGDYEEFGDCPIDRKQRGEEIKDEWDEARIAAAEGRFEDIPSNLYIRNLNSFHRIHQMACEAAVMADNDELVNYWYWGPSGSGKSRSARADFPVHYLKAKNKWWGGYKFQESVIIDDVDPSHEVWIGAFLKEWSDHYRFNAETKGSGMVIRPKSVIVTSQYPISAIFKDPETVKALERRFVSKKFGTGLGEHGFKK